MKVWIFQLGYRPDYEVKGVYATRELAEAAEIEYHKLDGYRPEQRQHGSWATSVFEMEVQGLAEWERALRLIAAMRPPYESPHQIAAQALRSTSDAGAE